MPCILASTLVTFCIKQHCRIKGFLVFLSIIPLITYGQQNYTLSGKITDSETGEDLIGVTIFINELGSGATTNAYGFYSLSLPEGNYSVRYSYVGYKSEERMLELDSDHILNIEISSSVIDLDEVVISAESKTRNITSAESGIEKLNLKEIEKIPVFFGETDILKTIQLLPGISNTTEGSTGFNVRGGSMGQNLILLDEATVYSSSHLMGFFSVFNSDALKNVTLYKGSIPANYGGRASSVLDVTMNNGNNKRISASGGIGLISTRLTFECPIFKDRMSFIISGRRTYGDLFAKLLFPDRIVTDDVNFYFYDLNSKLNYTINANNRLFLSGYFGKDVFELESNIGTNWGNTTGTLRWNHIFNDKLFSNTSVIYSKYDYGFIFGSYGTEFQTGIEDISLKEDASWYINPDFTINFGLEGIYHRFNAGEIAGDSTSFETIINEKKAVEGALYIQNEHRITSRISTSYGIRFSMFSQIGPGWYYDYDDEGNLIDSTYFDAGKFAYPGFGFEPRIAINYILGEKSSIKLSYNRMVQYLHLLSTSTAGPPSDIWIPSSNNLKPLYVDHFSAGFFRNFMDHSLETSIEVFYKNMINTADYEDGANLFFDKHVESEILCGKGRSYGLEFFIKKKYGKLSGWISYTLSRAENKIEGINNNSWYPFKYDKTHDLALVAMYGISKRLTISGVWTYATGNAVTFPSGRYVVDNNAVPYYTERNGYRMPAYHRLDLNLTLTGKNRRRFKTSWEFSIYNLYNRYNAYMITFRENEAVSGSTEAVKLSLFGIVPSITFNFRF